ncbi:hypothetical protein [Bacillus luti]|nr:hypothetical protein [Bacillus cereus]HDR8330641.1 hypothetical protein [Bacillus cereus]HDR8337233.1 hypothetical protein [Bacillus cereus]
MQSKIIRLETAINNFNDRQEVVSKKKRYDKIECNDKKPNCEKCFMYWADRTSDGKIRLSCSVPKSKLQKCSSYYLAKEAGLFKCI